MTRHRCFLETNKRLEEGKGQDPAEKLLPQTGKKQGEKNAGKIFFFNGLHNFICIRKPVHALKKNACPESLSDCFNHLSTSKPA